MAPGSGGRPPPLRGGAAPPHLPRPDRRREPNPSPNPIPSPNPSPNPIPSPNPNPNPNPNPKGRYAGFAESDIGKKFSAGKASLADLAEYAAANPEPQQRSAQCEKYESVFNAFALKG